MGGASDGSAGLANDRRAVAHGRVCGTIYLLNGALPTPTSWGMVALVAAVDLAAGLIVVVAVRRLAVRILPLAMLLSLSLVFPDHAPHRFKIALRANSSARLRSRIVASSDEDTDLATTTEDLLTFLAALAGTIGSPVGTVSG